MIEVYYDPSDALYLLVTNRRGDIVNQWWTKSLRLPPDWTRDFSFQDNFIEYPDTFYVTSAPIDSFENTLHTTHPELFI